MSEEKPGKVEGAENNTQEGPQEANEEGLAQRRGTDGEETSGAPGEGGEGMPSEIQRVVQTMMGFASGPAPHPLLSKFNDEHIHKFMEYAQKDEENQYRLRRSNRWFHLAYALIAVGAFLFLVVFLLPENTEALFNILKILVAFAGGFGSGYGVKRYVDRK